jgi:hypothetical protein
MSQCHSILNILKSTFAPALGEPLSASYSDLLAQKESAHIPTPIPEVDLPEIEPPKRS